MNYPKDLALAVIHILGGTSDDKYFIKVETTEERHVSGIAGGFHLSYSSRTLGPHIVSLLKWFTELASNIDLCRYYATSRHSVLSIPPSKFAIEQSLTSVLLNTLSAFSEEICSLEMAVASQREESSITLLSLYTTCRKWVSLFISAVSMVRCVSEVKRQDGNHSAEKKLSGEKDAVKLMLVVRGMLQELRLATQTGRLLDPNVSKRFDEEVHSIEKTPTKSFQRKPSKSCFEDEEQARTSESQLSGTESDDYSYDSHFDGSSDDDESYASGLESSNAGRRPKQARNTPKAFPAAKTVARNYNFDNNDDYGRMHTPLRQAGDSWNLKFRLKAQSGGNYVHLLLEQIQDRLLGAFLENELRIAWKFNDHQSPLVAAKAQQDCNDSSMSEMDRLVEVLLQHRCAHAPDYLHWLAKLTVDSSEDLELLQKFHNVAACTRHSQSSLLRMAASLMEYCNSSAVKVRLTMNPLSGEEDPFCHRDAVLQYLLCSNLNMNASQPTVVTPAELVPTTLVPKRNALLSPMLKTHNFNAKHSSMLSNEKQLPFLAAAMNLIKPKHRQEMSSTIVPPLSLAVKRSPRLVQGSLLTTTSQLFCPMLTSLHICVLSPLKAQLSEARTTAAAFFQSNFQFGRLVRFVCEVYLLGKPSLFDPIRQLCAYLTSITADEAQQAIEFTNSRLSLNLMGQQLADVIREQSPGGSAIHYLSVSVPFNLNEKMESSVKTGEFGTENGTLFDSLLPMESVDSALAAELHRKRRLNVFGDRLDEALLSRVVRELIVDVHLLWPVSRVLSAELLQELNSSMQTLLLLSSLRWLAEAWWKASISSGILSFVQGKKQSIAHIDGFLIFSGDDKAAAAAIGRARAACRIGISQLLHYSTGITNYLMTHIHGKVMAGLSRVLLAQNQQNCLPLSELRELLQRAMHESAEKVAALRPFLQEVGKRFFAASAALREALLLETRIQATLQERDNIPGPPGGVSAQNQVMVRGLLQGFSRAEEAFLRLKDCFESLKDDLSRCVKRRVGDDICSTFFNCADLSMYI